MSVDASRAPSGLRAPLTRAIFWSGLVAGTLDIGYVIACVLHVGASPVAMLQGIAAALFGPVARDPATWGYAVVGLAMHFAIAYAVAAVFCVAAWWQPCLRRHAGIAGPLYGAAVWCVMQLVVLPLTRTPPRSFPPPKWEPVFLAHLLCVGLPIAVIAQRLLDAPVAQPADDSDAA